jgi:hypothetical protein
MTSHADEIIDLAFSTMNSDDRTRKVEEYLNEHFIQKSAKQELPADDSAYVQILKHRSLDLSLSRTERYQAQAELEDLGDGHWDGHRTDSPPESWWDITDPVD